MHPPLRLRLLILGLGLWAAGGLAAGTGYELRVDGLACPYCAYGIEKKLARTAGVERVEIDINGGVVRVIAAEGVRLDEAQMAELIRDAGFTLRSMRVSDRE